VSLADAIENLSAEQLEEIIKLRRAVPLATFLSVNAKARQACALRHHGWENLVLSYTNAMIRGCRATKTIEPLKMATLMSAVESFSIGFIAKSDLDLEEYNLIIGPLAIIAMPDLLVTEQDWTPEPLPKEQRVHQAYWAELQAKDKKKPKYKEEDDDPGEAAIDPLKFMTALTVKKVIAPIVAKVTGKDAIAAMLAAMNPKKAEEQEGEIAKEEGVKIEKIGPDHFALVARVSGTIIADDLKSLGEAMAYIGSHKLRMK